MLEQSIAENKFSRSLQQTREYQDLSVSQFDGQLRGSTPWGGGSRLRERFILLLE